MNNETLAYLESFYGTPYIYSGSNFNGIDCSGLVFEVLKSAGMTLPAADMNAQMLHDHFAINGLKGVMGPGALCFYGTDLKSIRHVTIMVNANQVASASGGDSKTTTVEIANAKNAFVKLRRFDYRKDLMAIHMPRYT